MSQLTLEESVKKYFEKQDKYFDELFTKLSHLYTTVDRNSEEQKNMIRQMMREVRDLKESGLQKQGLDESKINNRMRALKSDLNTIFEGKK